MAASLRPQTRVLLGHRGQFCRVLLIWLTLSGSISSLGCELSEPEANKGQGPGHRAQELALPPEQELELGRQAYRQVLAEARGRILSADQAEVKRVRSVAARIVRAVGIEPLQREINLRVRGYQFEWEVNVVQDRQVNAFCLPAGKMVVFTGILPVAQDDDQLATVLSHETAHALAHHASERVARERSGASGLLRRKAYDRQQESEADHIGVFLMSFAGYNPQEAVKFWERMERLSSGGGRLPEILSDHPGDARRMHDLQSWVPRARAAKQAFDEGRIEPARSR